MSRVQLAHTYEHTISLGNLLLAWEEFKVGKKARKDVQEFERNLMSNIISLHRELANKTYKHSQYEAFKISDPKPRDIHKAKVRDRLLHHALYRVLYPFFDKTFIADSSLCRVSKGTHKAIDRFRSFAYQVSKNHTRTAWVLKCDIRKFFASINQKLMIEMLKDYIPDKNIVSLLSEIVGSFYSTEKELNLNLHPKKVSISTVTSGVDFLGWILFPDHRIVRTITKQRMFRGIKRRKGKPEMIQSYLGLVSHGNARKLKSEIENYADSSSSSFLPKTGI